METVSPTSTTVRESPRYRLVVLAMLVLVYTFNFIDRQIVGILAVPIKADLGLTDTQLGLMGGLAFALFYTALGIPIVTCGPGNRLIPHQVDEYVEVRELVASARIYAAAALEYLK